MRRFSTSILCLLVATVVLTGLFVIARPAAAEVKPQIIVIMSGCAYEDLNCNGIKDPMETKLEGGSFKFYRYISLLHKWVYEFTLKGSCYEVIVLAGKHRVVYEPPKDFKCEDALPGKCGTKVDDCTLEISSLFGCCDNNNFLACRENVTRQCFVPVTFTVDGWAKFCCPFNEPDDSVTPHSIDGRDKDCCEGSPLIPEGMVYSRFPIAFSCFRFFGEEFPNQLVLGNRVRLTFTGKTSCLENLCRLFHKECHCCGPLKVSLDCPAELDYETGGGCLAVETIALLMNIAYNDMRLMPKTAGVDLECYTLAEGPLEGKTVGQVLFIANQVLSGRPPCMFGLIDCEQLVCVLRKINANYAFEDFLTSNDKGYLIPDKPFGLPLPAHCPELKDYSEDCVIGPCVRVTKTTDPLIARIGDNVVYKYKVCNCGPESITVDSVTDTNLGDLLAQFTAANGGSFTLAPKQCAEFTMNSVVPDTDAAAVENEVTVTAHGQSGATTDDTDKAVVGILRDNPERTVGLPTTFTKEGWAFFCNPNNGIINGGMIYNRFPLAFKCFEFYGEDRQDQLLIGSEKVFLRFIGKTDCLERLCMLLGGNCTGCGKLNIPVDCPWRLTNTEGGGCLAVETIVLLMNVAYNDMRLMPRTRGVDLECYTIASGPLKGKTVADVFNIANELLQGKPACKFGLASCDQLVSILRQINANYEFVDFNTFNDRGFLIPSGPFNPLEEAHCPQVPMGCEIE